MVVKEIVTGKMRKVVIAPVETSDYKNITKKRYFFDWKQEKQFEIYKLCVLDSSDILGLISLERIPSEWRVHIRLLTVSIENKGKHKQFDNIAGNLIAHVAKIATLEYAELACVSLRPKTEIAQHYITKYNFMATGMTLSIEMPEIIYLINQYSHD
jgi:signal-transduction protein with cAMP-binding, CBS, and nucleotidyltransferase domain